MPRMEVASALLRKRPASRRGRGWIRKPVAFPLPHTSRFTKRGVVPYEDQCPPWSQWVSSISLKHIHANDNVLQATLGRSFKCMCLPRIFPSPSIVLVFACHDMLCPVHHAYLLADYGNFLARHVSSK